MEPRIIEGHLFKCKKSVTVKGERKPSYIKGKIYVGKYDHGYPDDENDTSAIHTCGVIVNEFGQNHCWPYLPEHHLWCHDSWTDYFDDITK